ncbi:TonB-dependent siderophore receptor [Yersinia kristensenii]|uniref:TonB-dependent siderophore receptor n=1 Tax=Yersinia kristensenii TaxID=28152 RepID=UPI0022FEB105|nr:TonB-dependent siderophore receptor [Yersinia kristensenii]MDA5491149.1 TonB-dependent siderophore receptor [Yersinia kristensenii]
MTSRLRHLLPPAAFIALCFPALSQADSDKKAAADTLIVTAKQAESPTGPVNGYIATRSSTATKTDTPLIETPQAISVVSRAEITAHNAQSVAEALRYTSGILQTNGAASQRFDSLNIRGFDISSTGMLRDGLRSTTAQAWPKAEPYGLERIEVLRGPSSVLYGQNSPGGIVNQISKRPLLTPQHELEVQGGSFDRQQIQGDTTGPIGDSKEYFYRLTGLLRDSNSQIDHVKDDKQFIAPAFTWIPNDDTTLTVLAEYSHDEFGAPRPFLPLKGTLLPNPNGPVNPNVFLDEPGLKNQREQYSLGYQLDHQFNDTWKGHSAARFSHTDLETNIAQGMNLQSDMRTLNRTAYTFNIKGDVYSLDNNLQAKWWLQNIEMTSLTGIDYRHTREDYQLRMGKAAPIDIYQPVYGKGWGPTNIIAANTLQDSDQTGVYAQQQMKLFDKLVLSFGGREDWSATETRNRQNNVQTRQNDSRFTYRAGMVYLTDIGLAPYASYSTSFTPELGVNFYGAPYKPVTAKQAEVGIKFQPQNGNSNLTLSVYQLTQQNLKTTDPTNNLNSLQIGEVRSRGVELQGVTSPLDGLNLTAAATYNDMETTQSTVAGQQGKSPTGLPKKSASLWADYTVQSGALQGLGFASGVRYIGPSPVDTANTLSNPSYTLLDAAVHYDLDMLSPSLRGVRVGVNVTNLTDKHYFSSCSASGCSVGYDRSVIASLRYRW